MKKLLLIAIGLVVFTSCNNDLDSDYLTGTTWGLHEVYDEGWIDTKITFTATHATITKTFSNREADIFTGTYTYDPPNVEIIGEIWIWEGIEVQMPYPLHHTGIVKEQQTMTLEVMVTSDIALIENYKKL